MMRRWALRQWSTLIFLLAAGLDAAEGRRSSAKAEIMPMHRRELVEDLSSLSETDENADNFTSVVLMPFSSGDYSDLEPALKAFSAPYTPFEVSEEPTPASSNDMYIDVLTIVSSKRFKDKLVNMTAKKISDVTVEAVIENTRSPTEAPAPGEKSLEHALNVLSTGRFVLSLTL